MVQRGLSYLAGVILVFAIGVALAQLAAQILGFSSPLADAGAVLVALAWVHASRRSRR